MYQKPCNLARAATYYGGMMGGGGGGASVPSFGEELSGILGGFGGVKSAYKKFAAGEPLLKGVTDYALQTGFPMMKRVGAGLEGRLASMMDIAPDLANVWKTQIAPNLLAGGAETREGTNAAVQAARNAAQARGDVFSNPAIFAEALNREKYKTSRFNEGLGQAGSLLGLQGSDVGTRLGLASGIGQNVSGAEQSLIQPEMARVGSFATLMNPLYGLEASRLNAQTSAQTAASGQEGAKGSDILGTVGTIAGAAATAY